MSQNPNLSGDQFFHGTTHNIKDGVVRPAWDAGKNASEHSLGDHGDMSEGDHAFAVKNDEDYAWYAAQTFHKNGRRPRVYEVGPAKDMVPGPWNKDHPDFLSSVEYGDPDEYPPAENPEAYAEALEQHQDEYGSKTGFPVKKRIDIMPGRQGTFPQVNWNRFKDTGGAAWGPDVNHPNDEAIELGHRGAKETTGPKARARWQQARGEAAAKHIGEEQAKGQGKLF